MGRDIRERRARMRVKATGTVVVHAASGIARGRVRDLSGHAMCVEVATGSTADVTFWDPVEIELHLDGARQRWYRVSGHVARVLDAGELVIEFDGAPDDLDDVVQDQAVAELECSMTPHVVLVDPDPDRREAVAGTLRAAGCDVRLANGPLEAIACLDDSQLHASVIAIADTFPESIADQLRDFIAEHHPGADVVVLAMDPTRRN